MLILTSGDKLQLASSSAANLDVHATHIDATTASPPVMDWPKPTNTAISSATTTDIVAAPAAGKVRNVKTIHVRNKHASLSCDVTILYDQSATDFELHKVTLKAGESLEYVEGIGWFTLSAAATNNLHGNANLADQTANAADTYLAGSGYSVTGKIRAGTSLRWWISATKTAAGVATPLWSVRFGTAGTTADAQRLLFTGLAQTAAADTAMFVIVVNVRAHSATGQISGTYGVAAHRLAATGFINQAVDAAQATSAAFDTTPTGSIIGVSVNPGAAGVWTIKEVSLDVVNLANEV